MCDDLSFFSDILTITLHFPIRPCTRHLSTKFSTMYFSSFVLYYDLCVSRSQLANIIAILWTKDNTVMFDSSARIVFWCLPKIILDKYIIGVLANRTHIRIRAIIKTENILRSETLNDRLSKWIICKNVLRQILRLQSTTTSTNQGLGIWREEGAERAALYLSPKFQKD